MAQFSPLTTAQIREPVPEKLDLMLRNRQRIINKLHSSRYLQLFVTPLAARLDSMGNDFTQFIKESYLQWIALGFAISLLIWGALRIRAYFLEESDAAIDNHLLLNQFRDLHSEGDLTEEEYRKLKSRINLQDQPATKDVPVSDDGSADKDQ